MKNLLATAAAGLLLLAAGTARAQTTDGYHSVQVFPAAAHTDSFTQQFNFTTPNSAPVTVTPRFFPGDDSAQAAVGSLTCPNIVIPANGVLTVPSLRALCPALVNGSAFGFLHLEAAPSSDGMYADIPVFAAYSRASNPQGNGFSVEAFPAAAFTSAVSVVNGVRRLAATPNSPAYQTNCFIANINQLDGDASPPSKPVSYTMSIGPNTYAGSVNLPPGRLVRLLDVFAAAGAPAGDYNNIAVVFRPGQIADPDRPGIMSFCTVQDNTSFGADFRIGKSAYGLLGIASSDGLAARESVSKTDVDGRPFEIGPGNSANTHVVYFRHPDRVQCQLLNPTTFAPLTAAAGLEMRVFNSTKTDSAGGNNAVGTGQVYLGDKPEHSGFNNRYIIEVESNEQNTGATRPYALYCASGSGNTFGYDIIKYKEAVDRF